MHHESHVQAATTGGDPGDGLLSRKCRQSLHMRLIMMMLGCSAGHRLMFDGACADVCDWGRQAATTCQPCRLPAMGGSWQPCPRMRPRHLSPTAFIIATVSRAARASGPAHNHGIAAVPSPAPLFCPVVRSQVSGSVGSHVHQGGGVCETYENRTKTYENL